MPPETLFSCIDSDIHPDCKPLPYDPQNPESYDSWSIGKYTLFILFYLIFVIIFYHIGVLFAEMILGTANIFSVDQRTSALISHRMRHASKKQIDEAMKLAAMAEMCIYNGSSNSQTTSTIQEG